MFTDRVKHEKAVRSGLKTLARDLYHHGKKVKRQRILERLQAIYRDLEKMSMSVDEFEMHIIGMAFNSGRLKMPRLGKRWQKMAELSTQSLPTKTPRKKKKRTSTPPPVPSSTSSSTSTT